MMESIISIATGPQKQIGVGLEVGITGLFVHHQGVERNIPIVRSGNIARIDDCTIG